MCAIFSSRNPGSDKSVYGLRPVFTLKSGVNITEGLGTIDSPYMLGV